MAIDIRQTQEAIESADKVAATIRQTQNVIEVATPIPIASRQTQQVVENEAFFSAQIRQTQNVIEIMKAAVDLSGIYFINPKITHDIYYGDPAVPGSKVDKKIPDPTIRLPLLGD